MALNCSSHPIFQSCLNEESLVLPIGIGSGFLKEGLPERSGDMISRSWDFNCGVEDRFDYGGSNVGGGDSHDSVYRDILELLPVDPFGMGLGSTLTAITGLLGNFEVSTYESADAGISKPVCSLFEELKIILDRAIAFSENSVEAHVSERTEEQLREDIWGSYCYGEFGPVDGMEYINLFSGASGLVEVQSFLQENDGNAETGDPHPALTFALPYLGVQDLLRMEMVCRSLRYTVKNDPLLWKSIHIDQQLNGCINDDVLLQLTNKAQGYLQCLSLVNCPKITDDGLQQVLKKNLRLTKLCVSGCTKLSIDGVLNCLRAFNSVATFGIKHLQVAGLHGVTHNHYEELKCLLGISSLTNDHKQRFYHRGNTYAPCDEDRALDIELCPRCQNFRLVYDCPLENCKGKSHESRICRACTLCIARCVECGRCVFDCQYEELFCLDIRCLFCVEDQPKFQERQDKEG